MFLYATQTVECILAIAFGNKLCCSRLTIGLFLYAAQAVEGVLAIAFRNKLCLFESQFFFM